MTSGPEHYGIAEMYLISAAVDIKHKHWEEAQANAATAAVHAQLAAVAAMVDSGTLMENREKWYSAVEYEKKSWE